MVRWLDKNSVMEEYDGPWVTLVVISTKKHQERVLPGMEQVPVHTVCVLFKTKTYHTPI